MVSDAHTGLKGAIARVFEARWRRCRVPWMRNALAHVSRGQHRVVTAAIRQASGRPGRSCRRNRAPGGPNAPISWTTLTMACWPDLSPPPLAQAAQHDPG
ncbi:transposase [Citreicella sp. C3M06]|uniref:transposase n=1 Tax=Citreicella sp. C3M06 TaxID=2841564 RepID=UPI00352F5673